MDNRMNDKSKYKYLLRQVNKLWWQLDTKATESHKRRVIAKYPAETQMIKIKTDAYRDCCEGIKTLMKGHNNAHNIFS